MLLCVLWHLWYKLFSFLVGMTDNTNLPCVSECVKINSLLGNRWILALLRRAILPTIDHSVVKLLFRELFRHQIFCFPIICLF